MIQCSKRFRFALACVILATICGVLGLLIVYHYATLERPVQSFAIVIDAGSTQTRSGLFTVQMDTVLVDDVDDDVDEIEEIYADAMEDVWQPEATPLSKIIKVQQVSSCVNGGPLTDMQSAADGRQLIKSCLRKFARHIKQLDFVPSSLSDFDADADDDSNADKQQQQQSQEDDGLVASGASEFREHLALLNHRVDSVTRAYMGATAGMRALRNLDAPRAHQRLQWIDEALADANALLPPESPHINKGFVGIIEGSQEAAYGWASVNFVCNNLRAQRRRRLLAASATQPPPPPPPPPATVKSAYMIHEWAPDAPGSRPAPLAPTPPVPLAGIGGAGTLELGGASAQMAYQVSSRASELQVTNASLELTQLHLFNGQYRLATRSDLCLGMSQAILRTNYVLLVNNLPKITPNTSNNSNATQSGEIEITNPCLQRAARYTMSVRALTDMTRAPCLVASAAAAAAQGGASPLDAYLSPLAPVVRFVGTGDPGLCDDLMDTLLDPQLCARYFSLCPARQIRATPPVNVPFVTISGYNKALASLKLDRIEPMVAPSKSAQDNALAASAAVAAQLERTIADKLGGYAVRHAQFVNATADLCATDISEFALKFPHMNKPFWEVTCMQLIYINKLLTEYYLFDPQSTWRQIKFLIFSDEKAAAQQPEHDMKNDIGWTLGMLLNATSYKREQRWQRLKEMRLDGKHDEDVMLSVASVALPHEVLYHHAANAVFAIRATMFIVLACVLISVSLLVIGVVIVRARQQAGDSYISHNNGAQVIDVHVDHRAAHRTASAPDTVLVYT